MSQVHPEAAELLRLLDGEATENRAAALRAHLAACTVCAAELDAQRALLARLAAPVDGHDPAVALERLMARVEEAGPAAPPPLPGPRRSLRALMAAGMAVAGLAAAAALIFMPRTSSQQDEFTARGGTVEWAQGVGVELHALGPPRRLEAGAAVTPATAFVGSYRNLSAATAWLLAFAIDSAGEVHWLYPAWLTPGSDPASVQLAPTGAGPGAALPDAVVLDRPAAGRLRCVLVVTRAPLAVSAVEGLAPAEREPERLRRRWPEASVTSLDLVVAPADRRP